MSDSLTVISLSEVYFYTDDHFIYDFPVATSVPAVSSLTTNEPLECLALYKQMIARFIKGQEGSIRNDSVDELERPQNDSKPLDTCSAMHCWTTDGRFFNTMS